MIARRRNEPCSPRGDFARSGGQVRLDTPGRAAVEIGRQRILVGAILFAFAFLAVSFRLIDMAMVGAPNGPSAVDTGPAGDALPVERADIVDRNGILLATSLSTASLYADPKFVLDPADAARRLVAVLPELDADDVAAKLRLPRRFVWLKRNLTPRQQYLVNSLGIPGLYFQREERRVYPNGAIASHVLGFANVDNRGLAGVERYFDKRLTGTSEPLELSIDLRVQHVLRDELSETMAAFRAKGVAGLVLDVNTGEVLGMSSLPDFDPNRPAEAPEAARFNRNTLGVYEMGSTFKLFTTAMALEAGTVTLDDGYDASKPLRIARFTINDYHGKRRWLSVPEILIYSSNIGAAKMALDVGPTAQKVFLDRLGLLRPAKIELEEVGRPQFPSPWREINTVTIAYGHGVAVSPLQMAAAVAAVVNGGVLHPTTLLKRRPGEEPPGTYVMSRETSDTMRRLMRLVVSRGTGRKADAPGYLVGGKTGTAEKSRGGGYANKALLSSFVGVFPMNRPRYLVLVLVDEPKGNKSTGGYATGGWTAAPAVGRIIEEIAPLLGVEPVDENAPEVRRSMAITTTSGRTRLAAF